MKNDKLVIKGARENNLKNINIEIPKNKLVIMTGLSGSGKTSLAFNTIYADYLHEKLGIHAIAGRYKSNEEWNTYYSQGFALTYNGLPYTSLHATASYGSAFILNEYVTPFRTDLSSFGTYYLRGTFALPFHIEIQPYVYVTGFFSAYGMRGQIGSRRASDCSRSCKRTFPAERPPARSKAVPEPGRWLQSPCWVRRLPAGRQRGAYISAAGPRVPLWRWSQG